DDDVRVRVLLEHAGKLAQVLLGGRLQLRLVGIEQDRRVEADDQLVSLALVPAPTPAPTAPPIAAPLPPPASAPTPAPTTAPVPPPISAPVPALVAQAYPPAATSRIATP